MKNLFWAIAPMLVLLSSQLVAQTDPNPSNNDLPYCETVKEKYQATLQEAANAESRTIFHCIDCLDRATSERRCELIVVQPDPKNTGKPVVKIEPDAPSVGTGERIVPAPLRVEILQSHCFAGGTNLSVAIFDAFNRLLLSEDCSNPDFSFLWEIDDSKAGHYPHQFCVSGKTAKVVVRQNSTGIEVVKNITLSNSNDSGVGVPTMLAAYRKTSCLAGNCPVFNFEIYPDGRAFWTGTANVKTLGVHEKKLPPATIAKIIEAATQARLLSLKDRYPDCQVWDVASTVIYFRHNGQQKQITYFMGAPESLIVFEKFLDGVARSLGWDPSVYTAGTIKSETVPPAKD